MNNWQIAAKVMEGLDLTVVNRNLAKNCIFVVCNHLGQPISESEHNVVEMALHEGLKHFWPQIPFEILLSQMPALEKAETDD